MENTNTNSTVNPASSTKTILVAIVLLILAIIFWRWSLAYRTDHHMMDDRDDVMQMDQTPVTDEQLDKDLDASLNSNSEIELKAVDSEF